MNSRRLTVFAVLVTGALLGYMLVQGWHWFRAVGRLVSPVPGKVSDITCDAELGLVVIVVKNKALLTMTTRNNTLTIVQKGEITSAAIAHAKRSCIIYADGSVILASGDSSSSEVFLPGFPFRVRRVGLDGFLAASFSTSDLTARGGVYFISGSPSAKAVAVTDAIGCCALDVSSEWAIAMLEDGRLHLLSVALLPKAMHADSTSIVTEMRFQPLSAATISSKGNVIVVREQENCRVIRNSSGTLKLERTIPLRCAGSSPIIQPLTIDPTEELFAVAECGGIGIYSINSGELLSRIDREASAIMFLEGTDTRWQLLVSSADQMLLYSGESRNKL